MMQSGYSPVLTRLPNPPTLAPDTFRVDHRGTLMRRTTVGLIVLLALGLFLAPYLSQAQSVAKTPRIGILTPVAAFDQHPGLEAFRQGLRDLGYVEGHNIVLEYRFAD